MGHPVKKKKSARTGTTSPIRPDRAAAEAAVRTLIEWVGENPEREGLIDTPKRVVKAFEEYFAGYARDADSVLAKTFDDIGGYSGAVLVRDIRFESRCEHHLAPFIGKVHIAYIPKGRVVGLSKLARLVDGHAPCHANARTPDR